jgi:hypothetical protein
MQETIDSHNNESINQEEEALFHDIEPILLRISVSLKNVSVLLTKNQALMTKLVVQGGFVEIALRQEEIHVNVRLKILKAYEMTNYPNTIIA